VGQEYVVNALRATLRGVGEVLITLGVVVLLFCVYQLVWTNVSAQAIESGARTDLEEQWAGPNLTPSPGSSEQGSLPAVDVAPGDAFAIMYIPALGSGWAKAVVEGVALEDLRGTVGHYPKSQLPGEVGNFAVAGHRATNGEPFRDLPVVKAGDLVYVQTRESWFVYTVQSTEIVQPTEVEVVLPVPRQPGVDPTEKLITLTTCNPRWASYERWITYGVLTDTRPASEGPPPELLVKG
jgi:sortase A